MEKIDKQSKRLGRRTLALYREMDPLAEKAAATMKTTCSKGCSHCCHLLTIVTLPEAVAIAERLLTDIQWQAEYARLMKVLYEHANVLADPNLTRVSYFDKRLPCVFLGVEGQCRIYDIRPTACRYHYVVSDPKRCSHDTDNNETAIIDLRALEMKVWQDGVHASKQSGLPMLAAPFQVVLLWALKLLGEGRSAFDEAMKDESLGALSLSYWMKGMEDSALARETDENAKRRVEG
jgi:Fe-S-cluster containining protein